ncbi:FAD-binding oxidoreductase [Vulgatibacter incomptus]|uniref:Glycolate dehydrogenase n=1 Tax=Vulgatibacter incomptus TaxID=1391653 RepID=A0A0K1PBR9_9BACT|nr:FAD-linked oxidase C-terminal domain-containing protein [Vulgatibacter incomptus]AKU90983.1 Glycolate dehydrogenase [Vulgatibacter incomptus]
MDPRWSELSARIGAEKVRPWDPETLGAYARDESGLGAHAPAAVVFPSSTEDVAEVMRFASAHRIPVTPCAARTGKSGGSLPLPGGIALSMERMNRILELSREDLTLVVQPGCVTGQVMAAAEEAGLFYPPDPNSWETCSIGGNVAENAGGPRALKYGVTRDYVLGLEAVLPSGEVVRTGKRTIKGVAGYDLTALLVGSEGTLAVITEITLRLVPLPREIRTALCIFPDEGSAARAVAGILGAGILPRTLELFDDCSIDASSRKGPYRFPDGARSAILAETDGDEGEAVMRQLERLGGIALESGAIDVLVAQTETQRRDLWATRRRVSEALRLLHPLKVSEDIVVPRSRIPEAVERLKALGRTHGLTVATYGHAGDGNLHANVLFDREEERPRVNACVDDVIRVALDLGGTITGEHGVGLAKRDFLPLEQGEGLIGLQRALKGVFDPLGILNPGKIFL